MRMLSESEVLWVEGGGLRSAYMVGVLAMASGVVLVSISTVGCYLLMAATAKTLEWAAGVALVTNISLSSSL